MPLSFCLGQPTRSKWAIRWNNEGSKWLFGEKAAVLRTFFFLIKRWVAWNSEWNKRPAQGPTSCQEMLWSKFCTFWITKFLVGIKLLKYLKAYKGTQSSYFNLFQYQIYILFTGLWKPDVLIIQGIDHLDFRPDKFGNQDIVGMVSAQDEIVTFTTTIYPVDAKGMVEKWLLQVEKQMIKSLRDTIEKAIASYYTTQLKNWVLDWPGQVSL